MRYRIPAKFAEPVKVTRDLAQEAIIPVKGNITQLQKAAHNNCLQRTLYDRVTPIAEASEAASYLHDLVMELTTPVDGGRSRLGQDVVLTFKQQVALQIYAAQVDMQSTMAVEATIAHASEAHSIAVGTHEMWKQAHTVKKADLRVGLGSATRNREVAELVKDDPQLFQ
jgi:hypothetical protein